MHRLLVWFEDRLHPLKLSIDSKHGMRKKVAAQGDRPHRTIGSFL
jgi:hypothetical protein